MKKTSMLITVSAAAIFSGSAIAGTFTDNQSEDIVYGEGVMNSSTYQPYIAGTDDQRGMDEYIMYDTQKLTPLRAHEPFERKRDDRDNSGNLFDNV